LISRSHNSPEGGWHPGSEAAGVEKPLKKQSGPSLMPKLIPTERARNSCDVTQQVPEQINVVIDISYHDGNVNFAKAKEDGIWGLFRRRLKDEPSKIPPMSAIGRRRRTLACSGAHTTSGVEAMA
jgi:hypothetical protein